VTSLNSTDPMADAMKIFKELPGAAAARVISDCHPTEGVSKNRTQRPIIHMFYLFSALHSLG
jgi:hypothetical protein